MELNKWSREPVWTSRATFFRLKTFRAPGGGQYRSDTIGVETDRLPKSARPAALYVKQESGRSTQPVVSSRQQVRGSAVSSAATADRGIRVTCRARRAISRLPSTK